MKIELVAKTLIVNQDNQVLVLRRHDDDIHRPGGWDLPGGQVDPGEDPREAAIREAKEETGLHISDLRPVHVVSRTLNDNQVIKTVFTTSNYTGDASLSFEHTGLKWIPIDELANTSLPDDYKVAARMLSQQVQLSI
ncbi:MAG: NUDIX hydrolase [Candidatus Saccharimonadales bacterium]